MNAKQKKLLLILSAVLAAVVVLLLIVRHNSKTGQEAADDTADTTAVAAEISALSYDNGSVTLRFGRTDSGSWYWMDDAAFPLDGTKVDAIAAVVGNLTPAMTIAPDEADELSAYGLDGQTKYISFTGGDGTEKTLYLGSESTDGTYYMTEANGDGTVYLISADIVNAISATINDMAVLPTIPEVLAASLQQVRITASDGTETVLIPSTNGDTTTWTLDGTDVSEREEVTSLQASLTKLSLSACVDFAPSADAYGLCGLSEPAAVMTVSYTNSVGTEERYVLKVGNERDAGDGRYAMVNEDSTIYLIADDQVSALLSLAAGALNS